MRGAYCNSKIRRRRIMRVEMLEDRQLLATITVNTTADDNTTADATLSLRQAIEVSDGTLAVSSLSTQEQAQVSGAVGASNTIDFNIPTTDSGYNATTGVWTLQVQSALPTIATNAAIINGYSQTGASENTLTQADDAKLTIAINGTGQGTIDGLAIDSQGSAVFGLDIENFLGDGVYITAGGVQIAGCFIGTDPTGEAAAPNGTGVVLANSFNTIGGPLVGNRNVISGNNQSGEGDGILVDEVSPVNVVPTGNMVENNFIGLDAAGTTALANYQAGVADFGSGNTYGGTTAGLGNVISGNASDGIKANGSITVDGNYIGTDATGNVAIGNGPAGVGFEDAPLATQAVTTTISGNVVSGNLQGGIGVAPGIQSTSVFTITNNRIGTNAAGTAELGNVGAGLGLESVENTTVIGNLISDNTIGIDLTGFGTDVENNVFQGNLVGTDITGTLPFGNKNIGVLFTSAIGDLFGGTGPGQGNLVAFNDADGVDVLGQNPSLSKQVQITQNSIFGNTGLGIYLGINGVSNQFQMPPHLSWAPSGGATGTLTATLVNGSANASYVIEIFSNSAIPAQGTTFVQAATVVADATGAGSFSVNLPTGVYTATATKLIAGSTGNTSQFAIPATVTTLASSSNPSALGQSVTFTAVVTVPGTQDVATGSMAFTIDGQVKANVPLTVVGGIDQAQFTTTTLSVGAHTVSVTYGGDTNHASSTASLPTQTVMSSSLAGSVTTVLSSSNPSMIGQQVTFSAFVDPVGSQLTPTGTVTFTIDGQAESPVAVAIVDGVDEAQFSTSTLAVGGHSISATYSGDANFNPSTGNLPTQTVSPAPLATSTTTVVSSLNPSAVGQDVTITAIVSASDFQGTPTGTVTFTIDGQDQAPAALSVVGGVDEAELITSELEIGQHTITAAYSGDTNVSQSTGALPTQVVNAENLPATTTSLTSSLNPSTVTQQVTFTAVVAAPGFPGTPTGTVTFAIDGQEQAPVSLSVVGGIDEAQFTTSTIGVGPHSVTAAYSGDTSFNPSSGSLPTQTVIAAPLQSTETTISSSSDPSTVGESVTFTALVTPQAAGGAPAGMVVFAIDGITEPSVPVQAANDGGQASFTITTLTVGKHSISATYEGDTTFAQSAVASPFIQTVNPAGAAGIPVSSVPPTVMSVKRFGIHMQPTMLVVTFSEALDPAHAQDLSNYQIVNPAGKTIAIGSASYDAATDTVTLRPRKRINLHETYQLKVFGSEVGGVADARGTLLDGESNGSPGSDYTTKLTWRNVVFTPAEAKKYVHPKRAKPAGALAHGFRTSAR
jgi:parallel beta-helix repeat protein